MYTELQVTSNFSFLRGGSHPEELVAQAVACGHSSIAIADRNTLAGIVRAHVAAKKQGIRLIVGCRLDLTNGPSLLTYPTDKAAYSRLCNLLTKGNLRAEKGKCILSKEDVYRYKEGMKLIVVPPAELNERFEFAPALKRHLIEYQKQFGAQLYLAASRRYIGDDSKQLYRLQQLSEELSIPLVATNDVHYHDLQRRELQDILTCIREKCTIYTAGFRLYPNAERYLKPADEMLRLFRQYPDAIRRTQEIADACRFSLDSLKYEYPDELTPDGRSAQEILTGLAWEGAIERYGEDVPEKIIDAVKYELAFIEEMNYAPYFLTVHDIVRFARSQNILCQGRGSAANSSVCYCLGITAVDPTKHDLLFERFISSARNEPPDIDVDFEHERREEVMQYIFNKYGRDRAAVIATVTQVHQKGAIRDVAKAMGLSLDTIERLSGSIWEFTDEWFEGRRISEQGLNPDDAHLLKVLDLTRQYMGFPRQLGQHTGGFVITRSKLSDLCPIMNARMENRTCIEWNKDDIDALGFLKIDVLALGMLTCVQKSFDILKRSHSREVTMATIPQEDSQVYDMICKADTIGVFQIESRAQQAMLPRLRPRNFYDLVIEVAIVRPGPIQGDMVHPYLKRRNGKEPVSYPSKELEEILRRTLGVPLFQEQAMKIAIVAAGFTPAEADELRRSMATFKLKGMVSQFEKKLIEGMMQKGYALEYAQRVFRQLEGFGSYGFPESHAASFANIVYVSCWLKCFYPDVFACALLNSMPMGFYQPAQIVADARRHGVEVRPVDINYSVWDNKLEEKNGNYCALRLGFRQMKKLLKEQVQLLLLSRKKQYTSVNDLRSIGISDKTLVQLANADTFRSIGLDRRQVLWQISARDRPTGLFDTLPVEQDNEWLPAMSDSEHVVEDYATTSLSLGPHPVSFIRNELNSLGIMPTNKLQTGRNGNYVRVAGLVLVRQRPGTAGGICFMTIEDETGFANLVIFENLFEKYRREILQSRLIMVEGKLQREGDVIHVVVQRCHNLSKLLRSLTASKKENLPLLTLAFPDEKSIPPGVNKRTQVRENATEKVIPEARNFR